MKKVILCFSFLLILSNQAQAFKMLTCLNDDIGFTVSTVDEPYFSSNYKDSLGQWQKTRIEFSNDNFPAAQTEKIAGCLSMLTYTIPQMPGLFKACLATGTGEMTNPKTAQVEVLECFAYDMKD